MSNEFPETSKQNEPMEITRYTYRYHNDSINALSLFLLSILILIVTLTFFIFLQLSMEPSPLHFKLNENLEIIAPAPLDQEGISTPALLNWVNEFVMKAFSFNYSNIEKQDAKLAPYFSDVALKLYNQYLTNDEDFLTIQKNKFVVSIVPKAAPEIVVGQPFQNRYAWEIQVPATIIFSNALFKATQDVVFDFLVWRMLGTEYPLGISVATFTHRVTGRTGIQGLKQTL